MALRPSVSEQDHIQGNPDAPMVLVEYGDYQCPHCGRAYPLIKQIQEALGDNMKFIFRNFPLAKIHPQAVDAALAAEAAALQGKFWEMHDLLFENQKRLHASALLQYAESLDLDLQQFKNNMLNQELEQKINDEFYSGMRSGVNATPTFFINGEKFDGNWESSEFLEFLSSKLENKQ